MKKLILPLVALFGNIVAEAQPVLLPNGDFENWTSTPYEELLPWFTSNEITVPFYNMVSVNRVSGSSGHAVRMETIVSGTDTSAAFISNSEGDILNGEGGVPYALQAVKFRGEYRCNIASGDTAWILVFFKKSGNVISSNLYPITGSQATFTPFTWPVAAMAQVPDSVIIAAISGNELNSSAKHGSWLELDELMFDDNITLAFAPDGDFENWIAKSYDDPDAWILSGSEEIQRTTDKHSGTYAARLESKDDGTGYIEAASLILQAPSSPLLGMPFTKKVDTLTGYYKYTSPGMDMGLLTATFTDANVIPVTIPVKVVMPPTGNYTYFELPLSSTVTPDRLVVEISSSTYLGAPVDGSTLYIDNLRLKNTPDGVTDVNKPAFAVYPNPVKNILYVKAATATREPIGIQIYDATGRVVSVSEQEALLGNVIRVHLDELAPGLYHYRINSGGQATCGKFVKQ